MVLESNFFKIFFPYGLYKTKNGQWLVFNRERMPIGTPFSHSLNYKYNADLYKPLIGDIPTGKLLELVYDNDTLLDSDEIYLYDTSTDPFREGNKDKKEELWSCLMKKIEILNRIGFQFYR